MSAIDRRQQILAVAVDLFSEKGFRGTTTKEIAQAAGVSEAIIFRHFATKEELYAAIIDNCACAGADPFDAVEEACLRRDDWRVFRIAARAILDFHEKNPSFQRLLLHSALERHELAQMFWDTTVSETLSFLGKYVRERQVEGAMREFDPMLMVQAFIGMVVHHSLNKNLWGRSFTEKFASNEEAADIFAGIFLRGVLLGGSILEDSGVPA